MTSKATAVTAIKKANHQANIVRIEEIAPHSNADALELIIIGGYQVVARKGQFRVGTLGVYIQPDSVIPQTEPFEFIWGSHVGIDGKVPEKRRRVTVKKFRGEWSEGLLLPLSDFVMFSSPYDVHRFQDFTEEGRPIHEYGIGDDVSDLLGITHYDPDSRSSEGTAGPTMAAPRRKRPTTVKGWYQYLLYRFFGVGRKDFKLAVSIDLPTYDVESFKNHPSVLNHGEIVVVTEKIHGSNARFVFLDGTMYAGSRNQWKHSDSPCVWRQALKQNPWIELWCRAHEGFALYGEVTPIQKGFNYGCKEGKVKFFVFDIRTPDKTWVDYNDYPKYGFGSDVADDRRVPFLYFGPCFPERVLPLVDGPSFVRGANHIREGIVIKPSTERHVPGLGRVILKIVSNSFLDKDSR